MLIDVNLGHLMLWLLIVPLAIIFALIIFALVKRIIKQVKYHKKPEEEVDLSQLEPFLLAYGGRDNILTVAYEMNRLNVTVVDSKLIKALDLKELGARGVLIQGNIIKCSFGERSKNIAKLIEEGLKNA